MGLAISLLFPPSFVILIQFFEFKDVAFYFAIFMFIYLVFTAIKKHSLKDISTPFIYFLFIVIAYFLSSMELIKLIPALISATFFLTFFISFLQKKELILRLTKKFYKKLSEKEEIFLAKSDGYWAFVVLLNTLILLGLVFYGDNALWAIYSSLGWYVLMFIAFVAQISYAKLRY